MHRDITDGHTSRVIIIEKCQNCGMCFIPNSRLDEIYCDYPKENRKTCREQGLILYYNKSLQENK